MISYIVGVDFGQSQDYTAVTVVEKHSPETVPPLMRVTEHAGMGRSYDWDMHAEKEFVKNKFHDLKHHEYKVRRLERYQLGLRYTEYAERIVKMVSSNPLQGCPLVVDAGGVGRAMTDMLFKLLRLWQREQKIKRKTHLVPITIVAGDTVRIDELGMWHVPKRELVSCLNALAGTRRLTVGAKIKEAEVLKREFGSFNTKVTKAANETFEARSGEHDDVVLALSLACWWGEHGQEKFWIR